MSDALDQLERSILLNQADTTLQQPSIFDRHPRFFLYSLGCLALIGYIFIFGLPVVALFLSTLIPDQIINASDYMSVSVIFLEIAIVLIAASLSIALFQLKIPLPAGRPINKKEAPKLYALIKELNLEFSNHRLSPKIDQIKITQHYEIKIIRTPRNGFPVLFTNTLVLGLPLLQSHSPKHVKTLIAREIIHLSGARIRLSSWIYFVGDNWQQYSTTLKKYVKAANILLLLFFSWYAPLFKLMSNGTKILENYFVDNVTANKLSKKNLCDAIIQNHISKKFLNSSFWPHLNDKAYRHKRPPYLPYSSLERNIHSSLDDQTRQSWLDTALSDKDEHDSSLSLLNRLQKLDIKKPLLPSNYQVSAARFFLGETLKTLIFQMDRAWASGAKFTWQQKFRKGQNELKELKELGIQAEQGLLSNDQVWDYIQLIKRYMDEQESIKLYRKILNYELQDARISFEIGRTMLEQMQSDGVEAIEKSIKSDPEYTVMACQTLTRYYTRIGDNRSAQSCRRRALAHQVNVA